MNKLFSDWKNILIIFLFIFSSIFYIKLCITNNKLDDSYIVLSDTLSYYKNKVNDLYLEKESYILDINDLKRVNSDLYNEIKKLKDNPIVVTKIKTETIIDSIEIKSIKYIYVDSTYINSYKWDDNYLKMNVTHTLKNHNGTLFINNISMQSDIYTSIIEKNKKLYLISRSTNPYLNITNVDGGLLSIEDSKVISNYMKNNESFFDKFNLNFNIGISILYDFNTQTIKAGPGATLGLGFKIN